MLIAGLFLAGIALAVLGARYFAEHEQRSFIAYSEHLMGAFLAQRQSEFANTARDYAVWDAMTEHSGGSPADQRWLEENVTASVFRDFGVDDALVLDAGLRPLHVLHRGEKIELRRLSDWNAQFAQTLEKSMGNEPGRQSITGIVRTGGVLQQVIAERIRSELASASDARPQGWIVFARELGPQWSEEISELLSIKDVVISEHALPGDGARLALAGSDGRPVAWLSWQLDQGESRGGAVVPLLLGLSALFVFVTLIASAVLKMHKREIGAQARLLRQSESLRELARLPQGGESAQREEQFLKQLVDSVRQTLEVARVTLWRSRDDGLRCVVGSGAQPREEAVLDAHAHAGYLYALAEDRLIAAADVASDPRLAELGAAHQARGVISALDAAVIVRGQLAGLLRIEETARRRDWEQDQINYVSGVAVQISMALESAARRDIEAALKRQQNFDALTGLPNAANLTRLLRQHLQQPGARLAYSLWHVSGLFHVNEEYGQVAGDAVLQEMAHRFEQTPNLLCAARISGTRFVVVLPDLSPAQVDRAVEALYGRLQEPVNLAGRHVVLQLSCGVSLTPQDAQSSEELLRHAEFALESARASNSSSIEYYAPEENAAARDRHQLAAALPAALARDEFVVYFQPLVDLPGERIVGAEALVRWRHPERGLIRPDLFIALAEETDQIQALGRLVLDQAVARQAEWIAQTGREISMAVNVSPLQLHDADFIDFVEALLRRHGLPPHLLDIEITESLSIELFAQAPEAIERLHQLGVGLSIDDFGTGYSSLSYLRRLPANKLKIDRSFIERVPAEPHDANLARMIIGLGRILEMTIVAEGIETAEQLEFLREQGCHLGQGYYFSRPVAAADFARLLSRGWQAERQL